MSINENEIEGGLIEESEEQRMALRKEALERRSARLNELGTHLSQQFAEAVSFRADAEREWLENIDQFETGGASLLQAKDPRPQAPTGSRADYQMTGDNLTRPAVLLITARIADMLFPTSDRNWDMEPSPDPQIDDSEIPAAKPDGTPLTEKEISAEKKRIAEERCSKMRNKIHDQLQESNYAGVGRDAIFDGVLLGTGVVKGPFPKTKITRRPNAEGKWVRQYEESPSASVKYVDLFQFYPLPCRNINECPGVFELELLTQSSLRSLAKEPGFSPSQIRKALATQPNTAVFATSPIFQRANMSGGQSVLSSIRDHYVCTIYTGELTREAVIDFTAGLVEEARLSEEEAGKIISRLVEDELISVNCEAWTVNGIVIKVVLKPLDDNVPIYHVFNYEKRPDSIFGKGAPYVLRDDQLAARQLWQAMMLNAMMSASLQLGVVKGRMEPAGGSSGTKTYDMSFTKPRVWEFTSEVDDIRKVLSAFEIPNTTSSLLPLYERTKQNANEHAMIPSIAQGEPTAAVPTSSGLSMLLNTANIVSRQLVKNWDDDITNPLITGMYDWNLQSSDPDMESAKGDYSIIPRGVSHLLVKDVQAQRFLYALNIYSANPELAGRCNWDEWSRTGLVVMELDAGKLLLSEEEYKAKQEEMSKNPPVDPAVLAEQNRARSIELSAQAEETKAGVRREEIASKERMAAIDRSVDLRIATLNYMTKLAGLDSNERIQMERIAREMESDGIFARIDAEKISQRDRENQLEVAVESPNPRIL